MSHVAFFGTGLLGSAMVEGMLARGVPVTVWNRTPEKAAALVALGASYADSALAAARGARQIRLCVSEDDAVEAILGALGPHGGTTIVDHSTCAPERVAGRAARLRDAGAHFLHAPVFMSPAMARERRGLVLASGDRETFERVEADLVPMATQVLWLGDRPEAAAALKLAGNAVGIGLVAVLADVLALTRAAGVPYDALLQLLERFDPVAAAKTRLGKMHAGALDPSFTLEMARKDVRLMIEAAAGAELTVLPAVAARMDAHLAAGHRHDDYAVIGRPLPEAP